MEPLRDGKCRAERRLSDSARPSSNVRPLPHRVPDRFSDSDDAQIDFTAPPQGLGSRGGNVHYMQQSLFSMIAAVGSKSDFRARFEESSDSDDETKNQLRSNRRVGKPPSPSPARVSTPNPPLSGEESATTPLEEKRGRRHERARSDNKPLRKLSRLDSDADWEGPSTGSNLNLKMLRRTRSATPRAAPVLSRMVEAQTSFHSVSTRARSPLNPRNIMTNEPQPSAAALSTRLMDMFGFAQPEKVLVEYACSLLQSMLLQGYLYVTEGHVCFYAYLPRKSTAAIKSGYLSKRGRKNPRYDRYWFALKGDVLSYYADASNLYFPSGHVDLRYGISASLSERKDSDAKDFQITTDQRTYYFRAESAPNAKEWVRALQTVIFRTHNEGESVKVSFPIANIIDMEESPMADFAETFKIRVLDSGETYAIEEVCF